MAVAALPAIDELLPQQGPMRLLDRVLEHDDEHTRCRVGDRRGSFFAAADGSVPAYLALEWMAQCAGVHAALRARQEAPDAPAMRGMLLGTRSLELRSERFGPDEVLQVEARHLKGELGLVVFAATVRGEDGVERAAGRLNVYAERIATR